MKADRSRTILRPTIALSLAAVTSLVVAAAASAYPPHHRPGGWRRFLLSDPSATLARVNALRVAFGAPRLSLAPGFSEGCARHVNYMVANNTLTHVESPGQPAYTAAGALAGTTSVLFLPPAEPFPATEPLGAWGQAPYHQSQVLNPLLRRTGFAAGCMSTLRGLAEGGPSAQPEASRILAWPAQNSHDIPRVIDACSELPTNPFEQVGWSCGGSGTALYIYDVNQSLDGCAAGTLTATLTGPYGIVPTQLLAGAGSCSSIVVTGRVLPARARFELDVSDGQSVLHRVFYTR